MLLSADLFVTSSTSGTVGEFTTSGATVNPTLISGFSNPFAIAAQGSTLYISDLGGGVVGEYDTSGATINPTFLPGQNSPAGVAVSGTEIYVAQHNGSTGINEFDTTTGADNGGIGVLDTYFLSVSDSQLFWTYGNTGDVGESNLDFSANNPNLFSLPGNATGIATSGSDVFVASATGTIGEYTAAGATVNASLITGLNDPQAIAISGSDLYVVNEGSGTVGEYTTAGATVNASLITGLSSPTGIVLASPSAVPALVFGQQPVSSSTAGSLSPITVEVEDSNSNLLTTDDSNVTLAIASGPTGATLGGTTTVAAVNGVATFSDLSLTTAGTYTLTATDGSDTAATSSSFVISPANTSGVYDAAGDFSTTANPNGVWSYGDLATEASPFVAYPQAGALNIGEPAEGWFTAGNDTPPYVGINTGTATATLGSVVLPTGVVDMHPGPDGEYSDVRFTAPAAGPLNIAVTFTGIDTAGTTTDVHVLHNGVSLTDGLINGFQDAYIKTLDVNAVAAGDTFDFIVGYGSNQSYYSDSTTLSAHITKASATVVKTIGGLDPTFGTDGLASHDVGFVTTNGEKADGTQSVLIGTIGTSPTESFGVTRYNADGSLDTTFGTGGVVTTSFGSTDDLPTAVDVLPGGQILVAGTATTYTAGVASGSEFAVVELNADGSLDTSFGGGTAEVLTSFSTTPGVLSNDLLQSMTVGTGGTIYLGGSTNAGGTGSTAFAIAALTAAGVVDGSFGTGGLLNLPISAGDDSVNSLAVQANGDLVAAGSATIGGVAEIALARFLPTGVLDKHFGMKGIVTTAGRGVYDSASSVVIQPRGQIVIGGVSATGSGSALSSDFVVQRYTGTGRLDRSFGGTGSVITSFAQPSAVTQVVLQADGSIVASGKTTANLAGVIPDELDVAVARYTTRGVLDTSFNQTGKVIIDLSAGVMSAASPQVVASETFSIQPLDASSLGTTFAEFIDSSQGVASVTSGGEILAAGNSGADTVEAEIITAGVDLVAKLLSALPTSVLGGIKGTATLSIEESGTTQATGTVTVVLQIATDAQGDGAVVVKNAAQRINLRTGVSHSYRLPFVYPTGLANGNYYLLATVVDGSALSDLDNANNTAASAAGVTIAPPTVVLVGSALTTTGSVIPGNGVSLSLDLTNNGNVIARGKIPIDLYLSIDDTTVDGTQIAMPPLAVGLAAGKSHVYRLKFLLPVGTTAGTFNLLAIVDPSNALGLTDNSDSLVVDAVPIVVS